MEIPLSDKTKGMLTQLFQQQGMIQNQIQLILQTVLSCHEANGSWSISPCGNKLIKQEEPDE